MANPDNKIQVSIIIPVKNGIKGGIGKCLSGIFAQKTSLTYEVIAIDSGSTDGTLDVLKSYPQITLIQIRPEEFGHGKTRNLGAQKARGDALVFINQDAWPANDKWLDALVGALYSDDRVAGVYGRQMPKPDAFLYVKKDLLGAFGVSRKIKGSSDMDEARAHLDLLRRRMRDVIFFSTVSAAVKKSVWEKMPFKDDIPFAEDQEWAKRVIQAGYKIVYEPGSSVFHSHNFSFRELFKFKDPSVELFNVLLERRWAGPFLALPYFAWNVLARPFADIRYILHEKGDSGYKASQIYIAVISRFLITTSRTFALLSQPFTK